MLVNPTTDKVIQGPPKSSKVWSLERDGVTQSMLNKFMTCKEQFRLSYVEAYRGKSKGSTLALEFGSCFHDILDMVYSWSKTANLPVVFAEGFEQGIRPICKQAVQIYRKHKYDAIKDKLEDMEEFEFSLECAETILPTYFKFWEHDFDDGEWVALEEVFDVVYNYLPIPIRVRGKFDGVKRINGQLWLFETKTKGTVNETQIGYQLPFNLQVMLYCWAIYMKYGEYPVGVIYNLIKRPAHRGRKDESKRDLARRIGLDVYQDREAYFSRLNGSIHSSEIKEWMERDFHPIMAELYKWCTDDKTSYRNSSACIQGWGACPMLEICGTGATHNYIQRERLFEELDMVPIKELN
jgi:hypothetical protein